MCFRFGSCFGSGSGGQDVGRSTPKTTHRGGGGGHWESLANHGYYGGADHKPGPQAYPHQQPATAHDEAGRRDDHSGVAHTRGNTYAPYTQDKAGDDTSKHPGPWNNKVGDDAAGSPAYTDRLHAAAAAAGHKENAAMDYHHYPATNTATLAR